MQRSQIGQHTRKLDFNNMAGDCGQTGLTRESMIRKISFSFKLKPTLTVISTC